MPLHMRRQKKSIHDHGSRYMKEGSQSCECLNKLFMERVTANCQCSGLSKEGQIGGRGNTTKQERDTRQTEVTEA